MWHGRKASRLAAYPAAGTAAARRCLHRRRCQDAWKEWKRDAAFQALDLASQRLLPLVGHNLGAAEASEQTVKTWCENEILLHETARILTAFRAAGIDAMLLKGIALAILHYKDLSLRPMSDIDLLVRREQAGEAMEILLACGWRSAYSSPRRVIAYQHAVEFRNAEGLRCDLHSRLLWDGRQDGGDDDFWSGAVTITAGGAAAFALNPADQLLHICVHGAAWNDMPPMRWVADAAVILRPAGADLNWNRLVEMTRHRRLMRPMRDTLRTLQLFAGVPAAVLGEIEAIPSTVTERIVHDIRSGPHKTLKPLVTLHHWASDFRLSRQNGFHRKVLEFLRFAGAFLRVRFRGASPARRSAGWS